MGAALVPYGSSCSYTALQRSWTLAHRTLGQLASVTSSSVRFASPCSWMSLVPATSFCGDRGAYASYGRPDNTLIDVKFRWAMPTIGQSFEPKPPPSARDGKRARRQPNRPTGTIAPVGSEMRA